MISRRSALGTGGLLLALAACTTPQTPPRREITEDGAYDLLTVLGSKPEHSRFLNALTGSGLAQRLGRQNGPVTLFAPVNDGFANLPPEMLALLDNPRAEPTAQQRQALAALVSANAAYGSLRTPDIAARRGQVTTWDRGRLQITQTGPRQAQVQRQGSPRGVQITRADILASDGVIHVVNAPIG